MTEDHWQTAAIGSLCGIGIENLPCRNPCPSYQGDAGAAGTGPDYVFCSFGEVGASGERVGDGVCAIDEE